MALETKLVQKLSQSLLMTPQLQQAIKLLQLGRLEYREALERELLENPILEELKEEEPNRDGSQSLNGDQGPAAQTDGDTSSGGTGEESEKTFNWDDYIEGYVRESRSSQAGSGDFEDRPSFEAAVSRPESLQEYLLSQLRMLDLAKDELEVALYIIGNIDKDGYLRITDEEITQACGCDEMKVENVLAVIRGLEPSGVGARDLRECLLIQLDSMGLADSLAARIVRDHIDKLERHKFDLIAKAEHVDPQIVYAAVTLIRELEPKPGRPFVDEATRYVVPDIYVYKVGGEYVITLNEDGMPRLRISPYYVDMLRKGDSGDVPNRAYLNERLKAATFLIKSIHQRQQTILKVTQSIVKFQRDFLDYGISRLKPLTLRDVAEDIGMHESTVSRVTTNKYVHTPQGVYELKYFFTTGISTDSGDVSSATIKEKIRMIIAAEPPDNPVSDQKIVEMLKAEQVNIARRTVAKYRETLGILSSSKRKKPF